MTSGTSIGPATATLCELIAVEMGAKQVEHHAEGLGHIAHGDGPIIAVLQLHLNPCDVGQKSLD
ncbi:MAG: hypothetical protein F4149_15405 [Gammaproteobacteria bacterium]|nr:hypothetical protein [Gammaproteobacteria bacterium]MYK81886.1 hypothetical protein [Gammaproteobacteria bacterium]